MRKIVAYLLTIIHYFLMSVLLIGFHPIQVIAYNLFGYEAHKKVVDLINYLFVKNLNTLFCWFTYHGFKNLPKNVPLIIISNHQSMHDIAPIAWAFRKHHPKFIAKKELGRHYPSISYNLRKGGSIVIDRQSGSKAIKEILGLGKNMEKKNWSVCIFPEGTRSKNGELNEFKPAGFKTLLRAAPNALIVPMVIDGNYKLHKWGQFPLNIGIRIKYTALKPMHRGDLTEIELLEKIKNQIKQHLNQ